ncbi:hypothetical protein [Phycicoccus avicenniae]|uniref:hypothetical protein n=1 Tax=Phycicoccus avicenniae TaxID=2828860 RepID=UPI003D2E119C
MILGADTDEMRDVQKDCLEAAKVADQVTMFLTALVVVLKAMSFWTGGSSAAYAAYLEGTVIPWLKKISMALKAFAQVLGANAQAQDEVSAGKDVDLSALPRYQSPQLPQTNATDTPPVMSFPGGTGAGATVPGATGSSDPGATPGTPAANGSTYDGSSTTGVGASAGTAGATSGASTGSGTGGTFTGGGAGGALGTGGSGAGSSGGGAGTSTGGGGSTLEPGTSTGSALGAGTDTTAGTAGGSAADTSSYDGGQVGSGAALGAGSTPVAGATTGDGASTGTYAAAGTAGALGVGGAAALAGRGGQGTGLTSPNGFDYTRIKGVEGNERVTPEFLRRTEQIATKLGCKPEDLMAVMSFETGGSFDPAQRNMAGGSARGLIQFMPDTARGLGTTSAALTRMTPVQQLDYVEKYFGNGRYTTVEGLYSKVLAGHAVNDPDGVLFREGTRAYRANRGVDLDGVGGITAGEAAAKVRSRILPAR